MSAPATGNDRREIPGTWSKPAEVVSPSHAPGAAGGSRSAGGKTFPWPVIVGVGLLACVVTTVALMPRGVPVPAAPVATAPSSPATPSPAPPSTAPPVVPEPELPVAALPAAGATAPIPAPPPTSSTTPTEVAPEDQGGDAEVIVPAVLNELPARRKARSMNAKAVARLRRSDFAGAEPILVRVVLIDPTFPEGWRHLGIARAQLGDREGARRAYRRYLDLAPRAPDAAQVRAILGQ